MKDAQSIVTFERFLKFTGLGMLISGFILAISLLLLALETRPAVFEKKYAADFYAVLQGKRNFAIYNVDAENIAKILLSWSKEQSPAFLVIVFEYLSDLGGQEKTPNEALLTVRAKSAEANIENWYNKFSDNKQLMENNGFQILAANPEDRKRIQNILSGEKIPLHEVDIAIPPLWRRMLSQFVFAQFLISLSYFLFCWWNNCSATNGKKYYSEFGILEEKMNHNYIKRKWWRLPWKHGWPVLILILLSPGILPLIAVASIITLGLKLKSANHSRHSKKPIEMGPKNFLKTNFAFDTAEREGRELLARLKERVRR